MLTQILRHTRRSFGKQRYSTFSRITVVCNADMSRQDLVFLLKAISRVDELAETENWVCWPSVGPYHIKHKLYTQETQMQWQLVHVAIISHSLQVLVTTACWCSADCCIRLPQLGTPLH